MSILAEHRRTIFSDPKHADIRPFMPGASVAEIIAAFDTPREFATHGAVYLKRGPHGVQHKLHRKYWRHVRPKDETCLFITCEPKGPLGGGEGGGGSNTFALIASIALFALTVAVSGGALAYMAPAVFGAFTAGSIPATVAAAAIGFGGSLALARFTPTRTGAIADRGGGTRSSAKPNLGVAGIGQNPIAGDGQIPWPAGEIRLSPPVLAIPYTTIDGNDMYVHAIYGFCGRCSLASIKINDTDIADLPTGVLEYETLEGAADDAELTLIRDTGIEESPRFELSIHRLEDDQVTLVAPASGSYPKPYLLRTAARTSRFRMLLDFPQGLAFYNSDSKVLLMFRIRIRKTGGAWRNLPEMHMEARRRNHFRQEIRLHWGNDEDERDIRALTAGSQGIWSRFYYKTGYWSADAYFNPANPAAVSVASNHVYASRDALYVHLDEDEWEPGEYDVEITRSCAGAISTFSSTVYGSDRFTSTGGTEPNLTIPDQGQILHSCVLESYTSFRDEYPIAERGLALIAIKAKNMNVNSLSVVATPYCNIWDGVDWDTVAATSNPAALVRHVWTSGLNARPQGARVDDDALATWYDHCVDEGLSCHHLIDQGSVDDAVDLIAATGDAIKRESETLGVVIDKDRSAETVAALFSPHNMTEPLVITKTFLNGSRGLMPTFNDETRDYAVRELSQPVFDDGVASSVDTLVEGVNYPGLTTEALVRRRARLDLRRARLRQNKYSFGVSLSQLDLDKGSLIGISHDILRNVYGAGRIVTWSESGGNLVSVTLNTMVPDVPDINADNLFAVPNVFTLKNVFDVTQGVSLSMMIQLASGSVTTIALSRVEGATLFVSGTVALPSRLEHGCLVHVGSSGRESRRAIIATITGRKNLEAHIEAIDEAPDIFEGLAA